jgi:phospholipid/cholesterol/gamma-HCH transport system substrate-binding protein
MMVKKEQNEMVVGMFVIVGFVALTLIVFFVSGVYLFRPGYALSVFYEYVSILDRGAPVRMAGVRVGEVSKVDLIFDEKNQKTRVRVKLFIEKGVEIRENYVFKIQGTHILSEPHIEITPEPGNLPFLKHGATIEGVTPIPLEALIQKADEIAEKLVEILSRVQLATQEPETAKALKDIVLNLAALTESLNVVLSGSEQDLKQAVQHVRSSTESLSHILERIEKGEGTAGKLLTQDELYQEMRALVSEIKTHPWKLLKRDGGRKKFLWIF